MADIDILSPGLYTSVQDLGRFGHAGHGVPHSGAMDSLSARKANLLLNNPANAAVLEITMTGPKLKFNSSTAIAVCGAVFEIQLDGASINNDKAYSVPAGQVVTFGAVQKGVRAYLSFMGGLDFPEVLGSRSMYGGITNKARISKGDKLNLHKATRHDYDLLSKVRFPSAQQTSRKADIFSNRIEATPGPEYNLLTDDQKSQLLTGQFAVSVSGNRMAIPLNEKMRNTIKNITTAPVIPGTVQLTPAGALIVLMRDCQVSGGYPRILQLTETGINHLSQVAPNGSVLFELV